ncbi:unnamed protein product [Ambrosiozyma monospora]|uniref:Unnamed protein product n=1 Tax=Ambrosiozyma monospora TaxID=43982 RepID=A0ACB5SZS6_AMBMO|nr:unnamed protein product [Ambrosiozyma monospora]
MNRYHLVPFLGHYTQHLALVDLIQFINHIESTTSLRIKFMALSQFTHHLLQTPKFTQFVNSMSNSNAVSTVIKFLYQETQVNDSVWQRSVIRDFSIKCGIPLGKKSGMFGRFKRVELDELERALDELHEGMELLDASDVLKRLHYLQMGVNNNGGIN